MKSKSIRILSVLILLLSIVVLGDGFRGFKDGWNSAGRDLDEKSEGKIHRVDVSLILLSRIVCLIHCNWRTIGKYLIR